MPLAGAQLTMSQIGLAERQVVADTMSRVAEYQIAKYGGHPPTNWITGTFYTGMLAAYAATGNEDYLRQATAWAEAAKWKVPAPHLNADQICTAQTYLDIHAIKRDPAMIADTKAALETMFNREVIPRDELGPDAKLLAGTKPISIGTNRVLNCFAGEGGGDDTSAHGLIRIRPAPAQKISHENPLRISRRHSPRRLRPCRRKPCALRRV